MTTVDMNQIGNSVCDMHDRLTVPEGYEVMKSYHVDVVGGHQLIENTVLQRTKNLGYMYMNKYLVVIGTDGDTGDIIAAYSYDGRRLGFYHFRTVEEARNNLREAVELFLETASPEERHERSLGEVYISTLEVSVE